MDVSLNCTSFASPNVIEGHAIARDYRLDRSRIAAARVNEITKTLLAQLGAELLAMDVHDCCEKYK